MIKSLRIGPHIFKVVAEKMDDAAGQMRPREQTIAIDPGYTATATVSVLLHEALHAIFWAWGYPSVLAGNEAHEESMCRLLEGALVQLIKDNPKLVKEIQDA